MNTCFCINISNTHWEYVYRTAHTNKKDNVCWLFVRLTRATAQCAWCCRRRRSREPEHNAALCNTNSIHIWELLSKQHAPAASKPLGCERNAMRDGVNNSVTNKGSLSITSLCVSAYARWYTLEVGTANADWSPKYRRCCINMLYAAWIHWVISFTAICNYVIRIF